jgi:hypothetical protein
LSDIGSLEFCWKCRNNFRLFFSFSLVFFLWSRFKQISQLIFRFYCESKAGFVDSSFHLNPLTLLNEVKMCSVIFHCKRMIVMNIKIIKKSTWTMWSNIQSVMRFNMLRLEPSSKIQIQRSDVCLSSFFSATDMKLD